jgi:hypothetical protein
MKDKTRVNCLRHLTLKEFPRGKTRLAGAANYYIYRSTSGIDGSWTRRTITIATSYVDPGAPSNSLYMLRAALLTTTSCGSYYNLTQGVFAP